MDFKNDAPIEDLTTSRMKEEKEEEGRWAIKIKATDILIGWFYYWDRFSVLKHKPDHVIVDSAVTSCSGLTLPVWIAVGLVIHSSTRTRRLD